jgi:hypothetical protein
MARIEMGQNRLGKNREWKYLNFSLQWIWFTYVCNTELVDYHPNHLGSCTLVGAGWCDILLQNHMGWLPNMGPGNVHSRMTCLQDIQDLMYTQA